MRRALCAAALLALAPACNTRPTVPVPAPTEANAARPLVVPAATPRPLSAAETKDKLKSLRDATVVEHGRYVSTASNIASYESSLRKYEREALEVRLYQRVPREPEEKKLVASLRGALLPLKATPLELTVAPRATSRRPLPKTIPEGERFAPTRDDVRGVVDVGFELAGADPALLSAVLARFAAMRRLFYVTRAAPSPSGLRIEGEAYWFFRDFQPPVMEPRPRVLEQALDEHGIDPRKLTGDPEAEKWLDELTVDFKAMDAKKRDYARALRLQGALVRFDAMMRFARDRAVEAGERTAKDVLAQTPTPPR